MPGKKITDHQVHLYKHHRKTLNQVAAAAKAGISERSARRAYFSLSWTAFQRDRGRRFSRLVDAVSA